MILDSEQTWNYQHNSQLSWLSQPSDSPRTTTPQRTDIRIQAHPLTSTHSTSLVYLLTSNAKPSALTRRHTPRSLSSFFSLDSILPQQVPPPRLDRRFFSLSQLGSVILHYTESFRRPDCLLHLLSTASSQQNCLSLRGDRWLFLVHRIF